MIRGPMPDVSVSGRAVEQPLLHARDSLLSRARTAPPVQIAAVAATLGALVLYAATMMPGLSFGDEAEMQTAPYLLDVPHPTGYPLFVLLGRLWLFLEPFGRVVWRLNLLDAVISSLAVGLCVLLAGRLGARAVPALVAGLTLATAGTVWSEASAADVNAFHMLLVGLLVYLAVRWRDERRDRWFLLFGLTAGLSVTNHLLALGALAVLGPAVLLTGWRRLLARPLLVPAAALLGVIGLSPYLFIPIRVALSPATAYPALRTLDGLWNHINGAAYRGDMRFLSADSVATTLRDLPHLLGYVVAQSNVLVPAAALVGFVVLARRDRWAAATTLGLLVVTLDLFAGYRGDLPHYLLVGWLVLALWAGVGVDALARGVTGLLARRPRAGIRARPASGVDARPASGIRAQPRVAAGLAALALLVPIGTGVTGFGAHDLHADHLGDQFVEEVLDFLPANAVLFTYWDAGEPLHYATCVEGRRSDVLILAPDDWVSFRPCAQISPVTALDWAGPCSRWRTRVAAWDRSRAATGRPTSRASRSRTGAGPPTGSPSSWR